VYRARDARLNRDVAVKVLPEAFAKDSERLGRFEQEARAAGALNHPNILTIFDVGSDGGAPYLVSELLEGQTLRDALSRGAIEPERAIAIAIQIAEGLGAAHDHGIVHRDLKPENLFLLKGDRVKILDFGIAKLIAREDVDKAAGATVTAASRTETGAVLGTVGYMSPEQVRGEALDGRSDVFSLGCILYEMLAGRRAFTGGSGAETMGAILHAEPEIPGDESAARSAIRSTLLRCLAKDRADRFRSAQDLAFMLRERFEPSAAAVGSATAPPVAATPPVYRAITFQRGMITSARFGPDGESVVYEAEWGGRPLQTYLKRPESVEAIPLPLTAATPLSISPKGDMAVKLHAQVLLTGTSSGTLAVTPLFGGAPRLILEDVQDADWSPDGSAMAIVRDSGGNSQLEYPIGTPLHVSSGNITYPRVSRDGIHVAFVDNPLRSDDRGTVCVVDRSGVRRALTREWPSVTGAAWSPSGNEVWFSASEAGNIRNLFAVSLAGDLRPLATAPGGMHLMDVAPGGRLLLSRRTEMAGILGAMPGETVERELGWLDGSLGADISADGTLLLLEEQNAELGPNYTVCVRSMDGSPVVRLGEGLGVALSPDNRWAITRLPHAGSEMQLLPIGAGQRITIPFEGVQYGAAAWMPDGRSIVYRGRESGRGPRLYIREIEGGSARAISPEGTHALVGSRSLAVSPDGRLVAALGPGGDGVLYSIEGDSSRPIPGWQRGETPIRWSADGRSLYVGSISTKRIGVSLVDVTTGERRPWRDLSPADLAGVRRIYYPLISADGATYAFTYMRFLADLYLAEGIR